MQHARSSALTTSTIARSAARATFSAPTAALAARMKSARPLVQIKIWLTNAREHVQQNSANVSQFARIRPARRIVSIRTTAVPSIARAIFSVRMDARAAIMTSAWKGNAGQ